MAYFRTGTNDFSSIQYENLTAGNIKKNTTVTVKDPNDQTLKSVTGTYTTNTFTNLTAANVKNGVTVTVKDTDNTTLKTVTGSYAGPTFSVNGSGCQEEEHGYNRVRLIVSSIKNVKSMTFYVYDSWPGVGDYNAQFTLNGTVVGYLYSNGSYTIDNIPDNSTITVLSGWHAYGYGRGFDYQFLQISSFVAR